MDKIRGGIQHTYGLAQSAINLMKILEREEYANIRDKVYSKLSKQDFRLNQLMGIEDINVRNTTLIMWHNKFKETVKAFPELVRTHVLCVETSIYRKLLRKSKKLT